MEQHLVGPAGKCESQSFTVISKQQYQPGLPLCVWLFHAANAMTAWQWLFDDSVTGRLFVALLLLTDGTADCCLYLPLPMAWVDGTADCRLVDTWLLSLLQLTNRFVLPSRKQKSKSKLNIAFCCTKTCNSSKSAHPSYATTTKATTYNTKTAPATTAVCSVAAVAMVAAVALSSFLYCCQRILLVKPTQCARGRVLFGVLFWYCIWKHILFVIISLNVYIYSL